jgi:hypothetical protein
MTTTEGVAPGREVGVITITSVGISVTERVMTTTEGVAPGREVGVITITSVGISVTEGVLRVRGTAISQHQ